MNFLIVEDETDLAELYTEIVELQGHTVIAVAANGDDAVREFVAQRGAVDLIIMDHRMPGKTGLEAAREILATGVPVKLILASADPGVEEKASKLGPIRFLKKPFTIDRLIETIEKSA